MTSSLDWLIAQLGIWPVESNCAEHISFFHRCRLYLFIYLFLRRVPSAEWRNDHVDASPPSRLVPSRPRPCPVFPPHALCRIALAAPPKCLIQPLAQTWQQSVTSAAAEQLPRWAPGASTNRSVEPRRDISPLESGGGGVRSGWLMELFHLSSFPFLSLQHSQLCGADAETESPGLLFSTLVPPGWCDSEEGPETQSILPEASSQSCFKLNKSNFNTSVFVPFRKLE